MARRLDASDPGFEAAFEALIAARHVEADVAGDVAAIIDDVKSRGDAAVIDYTGRFDRLSVGHVAELRVTEDEIAAARAECGADTIAALELAHQRIRDYHQRLMPRAFEHTDAAGIRLGARWTPVAAAGLYVPGGTASYPSSVLMNAVPARVAGVGRIVMTAPAPDGMLRPLVLAAAALAGIDEIWRIGGAQAIAALAHGTQTIRPVDKIVGPGNAYVAEAKRQVFGTVGIDMIAGPSEVLIVADGANDPAWIAADLLAQAEHDVLAQAIAMTDDSEFADAVADAVAAHLETLPRAAIAGASWRDHGAIIVLARLADAVPLIDRLAPEHLELACSDAEAETLAAMVRNAGAIFLGRHAPEAIGDYVAGPNHVLPTAGSARFSSGLGVGDFLKRTSIIGCGPEGLAAIGPAAAVLADAEGLDAHALSVRLRLAAAANDGRDGA
jgi:histidinol dehydrogenase